MPELDSERIVHLAQHIQRDRRELLALLGEVADAMGGLTPDGGTVAWLGEPLATAIRRKTGR